jgi:hypothetical protein
MQAFFYLFFKLLSKLFQTHNVAFSSFAMNSLPLGWGGKGNTFFLIFANFFSTFFNLIAYRLLSESLAVTGFPSLLRSGCLCFSLSVNLCLIAGAKVTLLFTFQSFLSSFF